ncbi:F-box/FBD/LRR-repeat protein-like protein [Tanacetum coccineum]
MQGRAKCVSLDTISNLPLPIIENILCSLPIKEAVRTKCLWSNIDHDDDWSYEKRKMVSAIRQVLFLHRGPIFEFSVSMDSFTNVELDQIIHDLARNKDTLKKLTLHFCFRNGRAFGSLTSLYFHSCNVSSKAIFHLLSNCPLLKRLKLAFDTEFRVIECCFQNYAWRELPTALVNLKCISLFGTVLFDNSHLPLLCHVLRSSPNLEKITLTMYDGWHDPDKSKLESNMGDCSDIWLQNLKELNISCFDNSRSNNLEGESRFVKLILAKSPMLKKVIIELSFVDADRQL